MILAFSLGGVDNLIKYLEILVKDKHASFDLLVTPSPKKTKSDVPVAELEQRLNSSFPNLKFERYKTNFKIHDRFYIGSYSGGSIVGVFGPSLNGLSSSDVVLVGEIESQVGSLDKLKKWFDL